MMRGMRWWLCACSLALVVLARPTAFADRQTEAADGGLVAVLRRDGLLLPFASFDRGKWKTPWPASARGRELPISARDVPDSWWGDAPHDGWRAVLLDGSDQALDAGDPIVIPAGCDRKIALRTGYQSAEPLPPAPMDPFPKDGLATTGGASIEPITRVSANAPEAIALAKLLTPELDRVEDAAISSIANRTGWKHPVREQDRHALSVRMDAWYRAPLDDPEIMVSWVELVRSYPPGPGDEGCGLETFFSGWVLRRRTEPGKARVDLHARVTYCDRKDVLYMLPFGRLKSGGDWFWIYQLSGWDAEWYTVTRVDAVRPKTVAEFYGGGSQGCPR
jgi:hypothetical protein